MALPSGWRYPLVHAYRDDRHSRRQPRPARSRSRPRARLARPPRHLRQRPAGVGPDQRERRRTRPVPVDAPGRRQRLAGGPDRRDGRLPRRRGPGAPAASRGLRPRPGGPVPLRHRRLPGAGDRRIARAPVRAALPGDGGLGRVRRGGRGAPVAAPRGRGVPGEVHRLARLQRRDHTRHGRVRRPPRADTRADSEGHAAQRRPGRHRDGHLRGAVLRAGRGGRRVDPAGRRREGGARVARLGLHTPTRVLPGSA
ncbi:hypothetical protein J2S69_004833 [Glycomyces lechevalierae]|uniref:Uncharacterized protein n=1 Tax=Glycomyces lechevalierae TaxID=256034 RepID=A0ABU2AV78_9ACTN|nr:hypothetical protein [Glycomyces lechevalierae]